MEKGKRDRGHRDTGRQRDEPEGEKHARQPQARAKRIGGAATAANRPFTKPRLLLPTLSRITEQRLKNSHAASCATANPQ